MEVKFFVQATKEHLQQFKDLIGQRNAIEAALKALHGEVSKYPKIALAREIADSSGSFSVEIQNSGLVAVVASLREVAATTQTNPTMKTRPAFYIDPATANLLLNSKLLNDDQKKKLLVAMNGNFEDILGVGKEGA